jgi:hypothetical protein
MNWIIIILTIEFLVLISFAVFIYTIVRKDIKRYNKRDQLPLREL